MSRINNELPIVHNDVHNCQCIETFSMQVAQPEEHAYMLHGTLYHGSVVIDNCTTIFIVLQ